MDEATRGYLQYYRILNPSRKINHIITEALGSSRSSAYKKVSLETKLSLDEILTLAERFNLSIDQYLSESSLTINFYNDALKRKPELVIDYLIYFQNHVQSIKRLSNVSYKSVTSEVPIYHFMPFKKLFAFKLQVLNYATWSVNKNSRFDLELILNDKSLSDLIEDCAKSYYQFSGVEIWNKRMIELTIDQIKYFIPMRAFLNKNDVFEILRELEDFIYHLEDYCETRSNRLETKEILDTSSVSIYINELLHINDLTTVSSDHGSFLFMTVVTPSFVRTSDTRMVNHLDNWIQTVINHSSKISGLGQKNRRIIFEDVRQRFLNGKQEILNLLNTYYP